MFEKRKKMPAFHPKDGARPSLEAIMALQKMLEGGLLDQLDENEAPPPVVLPLIERAGRARPPDAGQTAPWTLRDFFREVACKLRLMLRHKKPIGGSARGSSG